MKKTKEKLAEDLTLFVHKYARKAQKGQEPNDRCYDRKIEQTMKRLSPEHLSRALGSEGPTLLDRRSVLALYSAGERCFAFREWSGQCHDFTGARLTGSDFTGCSIVGDFRNADLRGACFKDANLKTCDFSGSNLQDASFEGATIDGAVFDGANVSGAGFEGAAEQGYVYDAQEWPTGSWCVVSL